MTPEQKAGPNPPAHRHGGSGGPGPHHPRQRARKGHGELLREEILDAADALLVEKGHPDAVSIRDVARRVGVSPPSIYLHFADKDELFFQCCARHMEDLASRLEVAAASGTTAMERLEAMGRAYIGFGIEKGPYYAVMFIAPVPPSVLADQDFELPGIRALRGTEAALAAGVAAGEFRDDLDPAATAASMWAAVHGTVMVLLGPHTKPGMELPDADDVIESTIALVRSGLERR